MEQFRYKTHEGHHVKKPYANLKRALLLNHRELPKYDFYKLPISIQELIRGYRKRNGINYETTKIRKRTKMKRI